MCNLGANLEHAEVNIMSLVPEIVRTLVYEVLMWFAKSTDGKSMTFIILWLAQGVPVISLMTSELREKILISLEKFLPLLES